MPTAAFYVYLVIAVLCCFVYVETPEGKKLSPQPWFASIGVLALGIVAMKRTEAPLFPNLVLLAIPLYGTLFGLYIRHRRIRRRQFQDAGY